MKHLTTAELEARMEYVLASPRDVGTVELIVRRPKPNLREELFAGEFDVEKGLVGDRWRPSDGDGSQVTLMNSRIVEVIAVESSRRALAGDQLYVDFDLSVDNLPCGSRIEIGDVLFEVTDVPHNGCKKFVERFGIEAMRFVNSPLGKLHHLRGIYVRVLRSGIVNCGDTVKKSQ